ncbi:MAG: hypothetical protein V4501_11050, partial [Pseudomonadota bacterium]
MADIISNRSAPTPTGNTLDELIKNKDYAAVNFSLRAELDDIDGIKMSLKHDPGKKEFPSGVALIRDATQAKPFLERLDPHDPVRQVNNMLLRALGSLRGIDHVLNSKSAHEQDIYGLQRLNLQT